jgi:hypothetical protein
MKTLRRGRPVALVALAVAVLTALAVVPAAIADKPTREVSGQDDIVITDQCAFPVLVHVEGLEIDTTFTNREGNPVKQIGSFPATR